MEETTTLAEETLASPMDSKLELVGWVMSRVTRWRHKRDESFLSKWEEFYCIWKGEYNTRLKTRDSERSRLIAPATQQAVDSTVAEMIEATFGRGTWFDISDELDEMSLAAAEKSRNNLLKDFDRDSVPSAIREAYVSGAIYGTGIAKRIVDETPRSNSVQANPLAAQPQGDSISVYWEAIPPYNFVIDTAAKSVEEALGCAHETVRPLHEIAHRQRMGEYYAGAVGSMSGQDTALLGSSPISESLEVDPVDAAYITEYHGLVPVKYLRESVEIPEEMAGFEEEPEEDFDDDGEMVEAIVTIANGSLLLKAVENPFGDRGIVAYAHDKVPNSFWGRGVVEKAYNSQKALDAELRARIDALGLMTYPVLGADATRLPRNLNLKIQPGKVILTNGKPSDVIEPLTFGNLQPGTFQQTGDLERYVSQATGSFDAATPININSRNETASGASMTAGSVIKRAKMTMMNVDQDFLDPLIRKSLSAYRVLVPERYPIDTVFTVNSTMSIMAREFEQTQMTNLLAIIPPETQAYTLVLKAIVENYSGPSKDKLVAELERMLQPDPQQEQMQQMVQQLTLAQAQADLQKTQKEVEKLAAEAYLAQVKAIKEQILASLADDELDIDAARVIIEERQTKVQEKQAELKDKELNIKSRDVSSKKEGNSGSNSRTK